MRMDEPDQQEALELSGNQPDQDIIEEPTANNSEDLEVSFVLGYN